MSSRVLSSEVVGGDGGSEYRWGDAEALSLRANIVSYSSHFSIDWGLTGGRICMGTSSVGDIQD